MNRDLRVNDELRDEAAEALTITIDKQIFKHTGAGPNWRTPGKARTVIDAIVDVVVDELSVVIRDEVAKMLRR